MEPEYITTRVGKIGLGEDGIIRDIHSPGAAVTLDDAKESAAAVEKLSQGRIRPLIVYTMEDKSMSRECRQFFAEKEYLEEVSAVAILVGNPVSKVLGNFFVGVSNPHRPTRIFTSEKAALDWLQGFIK